MILEANIYDNFNPNELNILDYPLPNGAGNVARPLPKPKARLQVLDYELWQTGYKFTSTAVFSTDVSIGDIVEVLFPEKHPVAASPTDTQDIPLSFIYLVTDVEEGNKATLQNYFWAMLEGNELPTNILSSTSGSILIKLIDPFVNKLMTYGFLYNPNVFNRNIKYNRKDETTEATGVAKDLFAGVCYQPYVTIRNVSYDEDGEVLVPRDTLEVNLTSRAWTRQTITTRVDETLNPSIEYETVVDRSNYNFAIVYVKTNPDTASYPTIPQLYTITDSGALVDVRNYSGDGSDLPQQRNIKTLFYDTQPTNAQILNEIRPDTVAANIYFNVDTKLPLYVNDLTNIWFRGELYRGYIADRVITPANDRLIFVEGVV